MNRFLTLPILLPVVLGIGLLILQPKTRRTRDRYVMASSLATSVLSLICVVLTYFHDSDPGLHPGSFSEMFSSPCGIDGASMVYGGNRIGAVASCEALLTGLYVHEGHENRFFGFWLMAYGVVLGIAYSEDFLSLYFFYEVLTVTTLPLVMHAMDEKARYAGRKYLVYSISRAAFAFIGIVFCSTTAWGT